jgi:MoxR-like ATPase
MAGQDPTQVPPNDEQSEELGGGAYEVLRKRLLSLNGDLTKRLDALNTKRKATFGGQESQIVGNDRIPTENNCVPRDIIGVGHHLIFGYNVYIGLKTETKLEDVFSVHEFNGSGFQQAGTDLLDNAQFHKDFGELYKYYKNARFLQFIKKPGRLLMLFQVGNTAKDIRVFRFRIERDNTLAYIDDRGEVEYKLPPQQQFEWHATTRDDQVQGMHPHVNILDRVFVECIGGDLTIKIENNTDSGEGIYSEPVDNPDQTLDDAEIHYATVGELILLRIQPYREETWRHFIFNGKKGVALRVDAISQACVELPEDHGLIFPKGYYLQEGGERLFDEDVSGMVFLESVASPNGEDYLYVFYHEEQGRHLLFQYNLITKQLANPIFCHGYSLYDDGRMVLFNAPDEEPKRIHSMQIWQTPFCSEDFQPETDSDSLLVKIGNRELVRAISEGFGISRLATSDPVTLYTYHDIIRATTNMLDGHYWLDQDEAEGLAGIIQQVKGAAVAAVGEFEKVVQLRAATEKQVGENANAVRECLLDCVPDRMGNIDDYVRGLGELRSRRGQVISLRELRYVDLEQIDEMDGKLGQAAEDLAMACARFLLRPDALDLYREENRKIADSLPEIEKIVDLDKAAEQLEDLAKRLDLLTDVVNNLEVEDATQTTQIVDAITDVYAGVNRTRAALRNQRQDLGKEEAAAEFAAQFKLVSQSITNYIGMCDTAAKCDEFLTKVMITVEELEGKFADYEEYVAQLTEKREEAYGAFSARKQVLDEERQRRVGTMTGSAERILKGAVNRAETFKTIDEVNAYFASDMMVAKLRDTIAKLHDMGESVKADDLTGRLKSARDEIIRRLRDKLELFTEGENIISFGDYHFTVNTQPLELTIVYRDKRMLFHLTGTDFYEPVENENFLGMRDLWEQELVSETPEVYRAEYLAYQILQAAIQGQAGLSLARLEELTGADGNELLEDVRRFAAGLYTEGYEKGVHDADAAAILPHLVRLHGECKLLRYDSECRAYAIVFWCFYPDEVRKAELRTRLQSFGDLPRLFGNVRVRQEYIDEIRQLVEHFYEGMGLELNPVVLGQSAEYLYHELQDEDKLEFTVNALAIELHDRFFKALRDSRTQKRFTDAVAGVADVPARIALIYDWVSTFVEAREPAGSAHLVWEVVALIAAGDVINQDASRISTYAEAKDMLGQHPLIKDGTLPIHLDLFLAKMTRFAQVRVPRFRRYAKLRAELIEQRREEMRLGEFKGRVMGSFVRNKLINDVYLNLVGANFAKQMGVAGESKRTDLMGLLLLISPPGYGKTTLMEYISNRLGLAFMKINGPAIGHAVTSLDPSEAHNATAREELKKLNLALEMGNNVMIYLDDIQHCNPELLQKFISLCDAQRKIEGVYRGVTRTYDLRGKKVAVVMAGNPYTESGDKFRIPDMLANRADTYNLGDISETAADSFALSFIENAMTSNPILTEISSHSHADLYRFVQATEAGSTEGIDFDYSWSAAEADEIMNVLGKLRRVQEVVLRVNQQYIKSAAQEDEYRTEPPFKLQGSYRNMCRMAEKVFPVMTDQEVTQLVLDHYYNEAQTLTTGAESNILKFKEMMGMQADEDRARWAEIKTEFNRRQALSGVDDSDDMGKVLAQLSAFNANLGHVKNSLEKGFDTGLKHLGTALVESAKENRPPATDFSPVVAALQALSERQSAAIDLEPLTTAVGKLGGPLDLSSLAKALAEIRDRIGQPLDLAPLAEALRSLPTGGGEGATSHVEVQTQFPEEYGRAWSRQVLILESLLPIMETMREQGQILGELRDLLARGK